MLVLLGWWALGASPADALPDPQPERCIAPLPVFDDDEVGIVKSEGLNFSDVSDALNGVIQHALQCERPAGMSEVHLTFELTVGCDGVVSAVSTVSDGGAPAPYVDCVASVIRKADFPAHDLPDGMPVTYPVDVAWD